MVYPNSNRDLFWRVEHRGAIVSEYYLGEAPLAWRFPARNRIIAGLSDVLVGVEAAEKSGEGGAGARVALGWPGGRAFHDVTRQ